MHIAHVHLCRVPFRLVDIAVPCQLSMLHTPVLLHGYTKTINLFMNIEMVSGVQANYKYSSSVF